MVDIRFVQSRLKDLGFDPGPIDGIAGRLTAAAVAKFQKAKNLDIKWPGTIGPKTLAALKEGLDSPLVDTIKSELVTPPWIVLAKHKMGLHEVYNNKELKNFLKSDGHALGDPAKLPWCGDFVETCIAVTLPHEPIPSNPYWALNWSTWGKHVDIDKPLRGCVGTITRNGGGHVFFIDGHDKNYWHAIGGNQSNRVSKMKIAKSRTRAIRFPSTYPMPSEPMPYTTFSGSISVNEA